MIRLGAVLVCFVPSLLVATLGHAEMPVVIVVPHSNTDDYYPYEHRLRSELMSEGFQPISVEISSEPSATVLKQNATRLSSSAAVSLSIRDQAISGAVWIQGRAGGRDLFRPIAEQPLGAQAPSVFAVKAADVLHGGLLELGYIGTQPEAPAPAGPMRPSTSPDLDAPLAAKTERNAPKPAAKAGKPSPALPAKISVASSRVQPLDTDRPSASSPEPESKAATWQARAMFSVVQPLLASPLASGVTATATRTLARGWRLGIAGTYLTPVGGNTAPDVGKATVTQAFFGPRLELTQSVSRSLGAYEFLDTGLHALFVAGQAPAPNQPHSTRAYTAYAQLGFGGALRLAAHLHLAVQAGLLLPFQPVDVKVLGTTVLEAAGPAATFNTGLQLSL